jgi:uracil permease
MNSKTAEGRVNSNGLILDVDQNPKEVSSWIVLSIQHILAMFVACITVPLLVFGGTTVTSATGTTSYIAYLAANGQSLANDLIAPTIVSAGVGTIFYLLMTKFKSPVFLASSFAYIAPMSAAIALGVTETQTLPNLWSLPIGMAFVGLVYVVVALCIHFFGVDWLNRLLPPIVVGPVIMVIGLSLASSAVGNLSGTSAGSYNLIDILSGLVAMTVTALCAHYGKKTIALIPFVLGMLAGYATAALFTAIGYYGCGNEYFLVVDWSPLVNEFSPVTVQSFIDYPHFIFLQPTQAFSVEYLGNVALLFIPVAMVTICEHVGDHENLSGILQRDLLKDPGLTRTLIGDGVATSISGLLCGAANTTYGENVAVVGVTKVASTKVILAAACGAILLGFIKPLMCLTMTIPSCVTGGVSLILYGFIAASGVKMLINERIDMSKTKNIFVSSVILVSGIGGLALNFGSVSITSIATSMLLGIFMNLILKEPKKEEARD